MEQSEEEEETLSAMPRPSTHSVRRQETEEESEAQRQLSQEEEQEVAPLRRQNDGQSTQGVSLRRQQPEGKEEEQVAPLQRQETGEEEEEQLATLRRQETGEEEEEQLALLRRQEEEEEETIQTKRIIARQEEVPLEETGQVTLPPTQEDIEPGGEPIDKEFSGEEEPSSLQALRRAVSPVFSQSHQPIPNYGEHGNTAEGLPPTFPSQEVLTPPSLAMPGFSGENVFNSLPSQPTESSHSRPNVVIEQLDVLIHEQGLPAEKSAWRPNRDRSFRARYLRRL
ncbi:MAG: hypothetical protein NPIRA02_09760 [Nitrospirales bacterium]|nr:MAG: hypothetical protein NPIRA02_09760 [Nitrospirales bacterium]